MRNGPIKEALEMNCHCSQATPMIKMKLEASGWPEQCKTAEQKRQFLEQCRLQDGINLDPAELDKGLNPALRQIAVR